MSRLVFPAFRLVVAGLVLAGACLPAFGQTPVVFGNGPSEVEGEGGRHTSAIVGRETVAGTLNDATGEVSLAEDSSEARVTVEASLQRENSAAIQVSWRFLFENDGQVTLTTTYVGGSTGVMTGTYTFSGNRVLYRGRMRFSRLPVVARARGSFRVLSKTLIFRDKVVTSTQTIRAKQILRAAN